MAIHRHQMTMKSNTMGEIVPAVSTDGAQYCGQDSVQLRIQNKKCMLAIHVLFCLVALCA
jgi:hypothetical protein